MVSRHVLSWKSWFHSEPLSWWPTFHQIVLLHSRVIKLEPIFWGDQTWWKSDGMLRHFPFCTVHCFGLAIWQALWFGLKQFKWSSHTVMVHGDFDWFLSLWPRTRGFPWFLDIQIYYIIHFLNFDIKETHQDQYIKFLYKFFMKGTIPPCLVTYWSFRKIPGAVLSSDLAKGGAFDVEAIRGRF